MSNWKVHHIDPLMVKHRCPPRDNDVYVFNIPWRLCVQWTLSCMFCHEAIPEIFTFVGKVQYNTNPNKYFDYGVDGANILHSSDPLYKEEWDE